MKAPKHVREFIDGELAKASFKHPEYTEYDAGGNAVAVYCRVCGCKIKGWTDVSNEPDGHIRQRFLQLGNYVEVPFKLNDGTFMFVASCAECAPSLRSPALWGAVMAVEFDAWERSIKRQGLSQEYMDAYFAKMADKRIERVAE